MAHALMCSTALCPYCFLARRLLERRRIPYIFQMNAKRKGSRFYIFPEPML